jgi:hypothetical protein
VFTGCSIASYIPCGMGERLHGRLMDDVWAGEAKSNLMPSLATH